jgi:hypothetical protein
MREAMRKLSRKLSGKNRNTALYMTGGDTGPLQVVAPASPRPDSRPMRSFREVLDEPAQAPSRGLGFGALSGLVALLAVAPALLVQWWRFGSVAAAPVLDTTFAWAGCAGAGIFLVWRLTRGG